MTVNSTGTGTLVLVSSNTAVGVGGTETFAVQFQNASHALITQFDASATSSGSMDLQSATSVSGNYAFTLTGVDEFYDSVGYGGVFADVSGAISGTVDENDANDGGVPSTGNTLTATDNGVPSTDVYGRGSITGFTDIVNDNPVSLVYYVVGPEAVRIIDVDTTDSAVGSAYGQGCSAATTACAFDSTSLGAADVFGVLTVPFEGFPYAGTGNIVPTGTSMVATGTFTGEGDDDEVGEAVSAVSIGGTTTIQNSGYGNLAFTSPLQDIASLGVYVTDPNLNLLDPNNLGGGITGGALVLDFDADFTGGSGLLIPQGTTLAETDLNTSYGFGAQAPSDVGEFDLVGQGGFDTTLDLTATGDINDPFNFFGNATGGLYTGVAFVGSASGPDAAGRYAYTVNPFAVGPVGTTAAVDLTEVMYEAGPSYVFSIDEDDFNIWLGTYQQQSASSLKALHAKHAPLVKSSKQVKLK
jgi:hypothetical protein